MSECHVSPHIHRPKKKWRLASQADPLDYLEQVANAGTTWRRNYASLHELTEKVVDLMEDQASRGQLKLGEEDAKTRFPNLVIASLEANKKDKPGGVVVSPGCCSMAPTVSR